MADRTVNININYKVNTADVLKAQVASRQADAATEKLRQSTKAYGDAANKAQVASRQADAATEKLRQSTKAYGDAANKAGNEASKALKNVSDSAKTASSSTDNLAKNFTEFYSTVKTFVAAAVAKELLDITLSMARLSGNVEGVDRAFKRAFPNSIELISKLRKATKSTITDFELMQRTLQATNLGVAIEKLPVLFEFAAARAQQTGESVDYLVDSIVRGIGRKSVLVLDNLGLSATRLKEQFNGASLASQSVADVTQAVGRIAEDELKKMGGYLETNATRADQITAAFEQLKITLSTRLSSTWLLSFIDDSLKGLNALAKAFSLNPNTLLLNLKKLAITEEARKQALEELERIQERVTGTQQERMDFIQQEINSRVQLIGSYNDSIKALELEREELKKKNPYDDRIDSITQTISGYNLAKISVKELQERLKDYLKTLTITSTSEDASIGIIEKKRQEIQELIDAIERTTSISDLGSKGKLITSLKLAQDELDKLLGKTKEKVKKDSSEVSDYLAYLSELEMFQVKSQLTERVAARKKATEEELRIEKEAAERAEKERIEAERKTQRAINDIRDLGLQTVNNIIVSQLQAESNAYDYRIRKAEEYYNHEIELAGNNDKAKLKIEQKRDRELSQLRKEQFNQDKRAKTAQALINGALAATRAFVDYEYPYSLIVAALAATSVAAEVSTIQRQRFAKGVINLKGPGSETSDSIPAMLSKGESVMTAKETRRSMGILNAIRHNKIDDRILKAIDFSGGRSADKEWNDQRIVEAIRQQTHPDYVRIVNDIYEIKTAKDGSKKFIRNKTISG